MERITFIMSIKRDSMGSHAVLLCLQGRKDTGTDNSAGENNLENGIVDRHKN
jgi:hypothetical protein